MIVHLILRQFIVHVHIKIVRTGLVGFEPTTAGLKGQCATWLRYRPRARYFRCIIQSLQILLKAGNFKIERFWRVIVPLQYSPVQNSALSRLRRVFKSRRGRHYFINEKISSKIYLFASATKDNRVSQLRSESSDCKSSSSIKPPASFTKR